MKNIEIIILAFFVGLLSCTQEKAVEKKLAYVHNQVVFDAYQGTIEKKEVLEKIKEKQTSLLDSLKLEITLLEGGGKEEAAFLKKEHYNKLLQAFSENNAKDLQRYDNELKTQINQYVTDFGKENEYYMLFGATAIGNLMYADSSANVTTQVINYCNEKYEGK